ncbi:hypothetical protein GUJ93_ZPchr0011g26905 [Zizania palustris]|uniref:Uncharacterized protein n=1 Tax=Zizania palustris TaxID=103762 RepID=A0A8J5WGB8_ZIZPA|nr:hypothetical protein GUJ93_ZPchr0011g26905 [Zizania palustris]
MPSSDEEDPPQPITSATTPVTHVATPAISEPFSKIITELVHSVAGINAYLAAKDNQFSFDMQGAGITAAGPSFVPGRSTPTPFLPGPPGISLMGLPSTSLTMGGTPAPYTQAQSTLPRGQERHGR